MGLVPPDGPPPRDVLERLVQDSIASMVALRRSLRGLILATVVLFMISGATVLKVSSVARENTHALCTLRADVTARRDGARKYLRDHPAGFPGVPASALRVSISNQTATIRALGGINCG